MRKLHWFLGAALTCLLLFCGTAFAQEARDMTGECVLKGSLNPKMVRFVADRDYVTYWRSQPGVKAFLEVTLPEGKTCGSVFIKWARQGISFRVQVKMET